MVKLIAEAHTSAEIAELLVDQPQDGRAPSREPDGQARDARPRRADALRDPARARRAVAAGTDAHGPPMRPRGRRWARAPNGERRAGDQHDGGVPRLLVLWTRPHHLSRRGGDALGARRGRALLELPTRSQRASSPSCERRARAPGALCDWLLELRRRRPGVGRAQLRRRAGCADWLGDLRLLGHAADRPARGERDARAGGRRLMALAVVALRRRARASSPPSASTGPRSRCSAPCWCCSRRRSSRTQAIEAIDWNTLGLLAGMMLMVKVTEPTGVYTWLAIRAGQLSRGRPLAVVVVAGRRRPRCCRRSWTTSRRCC